MFRWRRKSVPTEAAPETAPEAPGTHAAEVASAPAPVPSVSLATGELAAIAARLHGGPVRRPHVPTHKAEEPRMRGPVAAREPGPEPVAVDAAAVDAAEPDLRPLALIVQAALAHHFGPDGAWALVRRTPDTTAGFFDELMTAHIARDVALALGASPAAARLPLEDARGDGPADRQPAERERAARQDGIARELAVFDADPLDGDLVALAGDPRRVPATLRAVRSA
jgi:hypothetical protein